MMCANFECILFRRYKTTKHHIISMLVSKFCIKEKCMM